MSKDLRDCEPKFIGPFTKRQLICVVIGLGYGIPVFFLFDGIEQLFVRILVTIITMIPAIACGWCDMYGLHLEQFIFHIIKNYVLTPGKRKYKNQNAYEVIYQSLTSTNTNQSIKVKRSKNDGRIK